MNSIFVKLRYTKRLHTKCFLHRIVGTHYASNKTHDGNLQVLKNLVQNVIYYLNYTERVDRSFSSIDILTDQMNTTRKVFLFIFS